MEKKGFWWGKWNSVSKWLIEMKWKCVNMVTMLQDLHKYIFFIQLALWGDHCTAFSLTSHTRRGFQVKSSWYCARHLTVSSSLLVFSIYFASLSFRNSSTLSVFHLSMLRTSLTSLFSSWSLRTGSAPRTKFILRLGNFAGLSLRTKACIWGNLPIFQLHTSREAKAYRLVASSWPSAWQHFRQFCSRDGSDVRLKGFNSSHELQSRLTENPKSLHCSGVNSDTENWIRAKKTESKGEK